MLRALLVCLIFSALFFSSCDFIPAKKRMLVYTQITATNDTLEKLTREWHQVLLTCMKDKNFSRLRPVRINTGQFLSRNRSVVANLEVAAGSQALLDSEEVYLSNQAIIVTDTYAPFESFNEVTPNIEINGQLKLITNDLSNVIAQKAAISRSLEYYLVKNSLKIEKGPKVEKMKRSLKK